MKKKSKLSLIAMILGILAAMLMIGVLFGSSNPSASQAERIGQGIGQMIVLPSVICMVVAVIFNVLGYFMVSRPLTLVSAIFYTLSLILMPLWGFLGIPSLILQFVSYSKLKNSQETMA